jgi:hypothetical protein
MKKTVGLLATLAIVGAGGDVHASLLSSIQGVATKIGGAQAGQLVGNLANTAGTLVQQKINVISDPVRSNVISNATTLQNNLNVQIQTIDQQLQNPLLDASTRVAYTNVRQSYVNASTPLGQLTSLVQTTPATPQGASIILQQAPILTAQVRASLANTAYAQSAETLNMTVGSLTTSLATQAGTINSAAGVVNTQVNTYGNMVTQAR